MLQVYANTLFPRAQSPLGGFPFGPVGFGAPGFGGPDSFMGSPALGGGFFQPAANMLAMATTVDLYQSLGQNQDQMAGIASKIAADSAKLNELSAKLHGCMPCYKMQIEQQMKQLQSEIQQLQQQYQQCQMQGMQSMQKAAGRYAAASLMGAFGFGL